jgi:hypothetical protein
VQDFTVSINNGPDMLFINRPTYFIDSLSGNDDIVVREPAPNQAVWNVQLYVAAGAPASGANRLGDNIELETPGSQAVTYSPDNPLSSIPAVAGVIFTTPATGGGQFNDGTNTSTVSAAQFLFPGFYQSSAGGAENFIYAGENGNDSLTYNTPANANAGSSLTYTPGATPDAGSVTGSQIGGADLTPLTFSALGGGGSLTFTTANAARHDHLIIQDLPAAGDVFNVTPGAAGGVGGGAAGSVQIVHAPSNSTAVTLPLLTPGVSVLELQGQGGSDTFNLTGSAGGNALPWTGLTVNDGNTVNLNAAVGPVTVTIGDNTPNSPNPNTVITGYGVPVTLIGVDTANLDVNGQTLTGTGTTQNDNWIFTPTGATAGTFYDSIGSGNNLVPNTVFNVVNVSGNFMVFNDPGGNADQVTLRGTAARDLFQISQGSGIAQVLANNVTPLLPVELGMSAEILNAVGLGGINTFQVIPAPGLAGQAQDNLLVNIDGGTGGQSNALVVAASFAGVGGATAPLAANQFVVVNKISDSSGAVRVFTAAVANPDINYQNVQVVSPNVANNTVPGVNPNLLVMGPDNFEGNNQLGNAAFLGAGSTLQIQHATLFPNNTEFPGVPADQDFYRVVTQTTGTLDFQVYFRTFNTALLPGGGQLDLQAFDVAGNVIAAAPGVFGADPGTGNARIRIPAVAGQSYYLRVFGATAGTVNGYNATIINTAPPTPFNLELSRSVLSATITNPGAGYTSPPAVQITGGGGTGATGTAYLGTGAQAGQVVAITISEGTGYTSAPNIQLIGGGGAGATATATITDGGDLPTNSPNDDSGRSQFDNVTNVNTPRIYLRLSDGIFLNDLPGNGTPDNPPAGVIPIPFSPNATTPGYRVALFDGNNTQTPIAFATPSGAGFPGLYQVDITTPLADGVHHLVAAVQMVDPANPTETGFGALSTSVDIIVDTVAPPVFFGTNTNNNNGLAANSDSGLNVDQPTLSDRITNVTFPTFYGTAEANAIIRVYALANTGALAGQNILIAQTVATPTDGTNVFPGGTWSVQSVVNLNDPNYFTRDGTRQIQVTGEDLAGNVTNPASTMFIFLDTSGPQVQNVQITGSPNFNLFGEKPSNFNQGPTPLVRMLTVTFVDNPNRDTVNFPNYVALDAALFNQVAKGGGLFTLRGDNNGLVVIQSVTLVNNPPVNGQPATATVTLAFSTPLPDDRYTLTISDTITDPAGNALDGETNTAEPQTTPLFPSGNGVPGGQFIARFTVNSRPHIGTYSNTVVQLDINADGVWDPTAGTDAVNRDIAFNFGAFTDSLFAGNFAPVGQSGNGFSKLAAYSQVNGVFRWLMDFNGDGVPDLSVASGLQIDGLPVAGRFNPAINADEIALFDSTTGTWYIDFNHTNNLGPSSLVVHDGLRGYPLVGDFDGDGKIDLATFQPDTNTWQFDFAANGYGGVDATLNFGLPSVREIPVAADMNRDGITDIGLYEPGSVDPNTSTPAQWYFLESAGPVALANFVPNANSPFKGTINALNHQFAPSPFSQDQSYTFGADVALPIVGTFDPPLDAANSAGTTQNTVTVQEGSPPVSNVTVEGDIGYVGMNSSAGLLSRYVDANSMYYDGLGNQNGTMYAQIWRDYGGNWTRLSMAPIQATGGHLKFVTIGSSLQLYLDNQLVTNATDTMLTQGLIGTWADPGNTVSNLTSNQPTYTKSQLPFTDSLNQADGSGLSNSWVQSAGTFVFQGGVLVSQDNASVATLYGLSQADSSVQVDIQRASSGSMALVSRYVNAGTMYWAGLINYSGTYYAEIWRDYGGSWQVLASRRATGTTGTLRLLTEGSTLQLFLNGTLQAFASDTWITSGSVGIYAGYGAALANFQAAAPTFTNAALSFQDNFTQADGSLPSTNWYEQRGTFTDQGGVLVGRDGTNIITLNGISQADVAVRADVQGVPFNGSAGLLARYQTSGDTYWGGLDNYGGAVWAEIWRRSGGAWSLLDSRPVSVAATGTLRFEVLGSSLKLYLNNSAVSIATDHGISAGGSVGLYGGQGVFFDNFQASGLAAVTPMLPYNNNFNVANGTQLGYEWDAQAGNFSVQSGAAVGQGGVNVVTLHGVNPVSPDLEADVTNLPFDGSAGLISRYQSSGDMYWAGLVSENGVVWAEMWRKYQGVWQWLGGQQLNASQLVALNAGSVHLSFLTSGSSLKLLVNGQLTLTAVDTLLTSGAAGLYGTQGVGFDNVYVQ